MRKIRSLSALPILCLMLMSIAAVQAHAPSELLLSYDGGVLQARFTHEVDNPAVHYIRRVEVEGAGTPLQREFEYTSQPSRDVFTYSYPIALPSGSIIRVKAECSIGGQIQREFLVPSSDQTTSVTTPVPAETPTAVTSATQTVTPTTTVAPGFGWSVAALASVIAVLAIFLIRSRGS